MFKVKQWRRYNFPLGGIQFTNFTHLWFFFLVKSECKPPTHCIYATECIVQWQGKMLIFGRKS